MKKETKKTKKTKKSESLAEYVGHKLLDYMDEFLEDRKIQEYCPYDVARAFNVEAAKIAAAMFMSAADMHVKIALEERK